MLQRRSSAIVRYRTACAALIAMVVLPVVTVLSTSQTTSADFAPLDLSVGLLEGGTTTMDDAPVQGVRGERPQRQSLRAWVFGLWLLGVAALSVLHLAGFRRTRQLRTHGVAGAGLEWEVVVRELSRRMGIKRVVRVFKSSLVSVPTVVGWLTPVILIPASAFAGMPADQLRYIIAHELAHVRRSDYLINLFQVVAETLFFFHPAMWWVSGQIRQEREHCCDDMAAMVGGDRFAYARALLSLEEMRSFSHGYAVNATGGSLLRRIRRMLGGYGMYQLNRPSVAGVTLAAFLIVGATAISVTAQRGNDADAGKSAPIELAQNDDTSTRSTFESMEREFTHEGTWHLEHEDDEGAYLNIRTGRYNNRWNMGSKIELDDLTGFEVGDNVAFEMRREAGTFYFVGEVDRDRVGFEGDGDFGFVPNEDYLEEMKALGVTGINDERQMGLAFQGVGPQYVKDLKKLGYDAPSGKRLWELAIHGASIAYIKEWRDRGYTDLSYKEIVKMRIHGVTAEFADEMAKLGYDDPSSDELIKWRIHGVTPAFVRSMAAAGYDDASEDELIKWRIHGVDPEFVEGLEKMGYGRMSSNELVQWRIHGVTPEFIGEMAKLGYDDPSPNELVQWRIHGVTPRFVEDLAQMGYDDMSSNELVQWRIHGVTPAYVEDLADLGYSDVRSKDLVRMRIHGVSPSFIRHLQDKGYDDLSVDDLVKIKIHNIDL